MSGKNTLMIVGKIGHKIIINNKSNTNINTNIYDSSSN